MNKEIVEGKTKIDRIHKPPTQCQRIMHYFQCFHSIYLVTSDFMCEMRFAYSLCSAMVTFSLDALPHFGKSLCAASAYVPNSDQPLLLG